jgi:hypothetical protein
MDTPEYPEPEMPKAIWSHRDHPALSWGCTIHAFGIDHYEDNLDDDELGWVDPTVSPARLLLDIDYILHWVAPTIPGRGYHWWTAPATLAFEQAWDISVNYGPHLLMPVIDDVRRLDPPDSQPDPLWHITGKTFDIRVRCSGYDLCLRRPPRYGHRDQSLASRGGISFARQPYA